jgi:hypothetical protein
MKIATRRVHNSILVGIIVVVISWLSISPTRTTAQTPGNNAVYNASGTCSPRCADSGAFIDAKVFTSSPPTNNFCSVLNWVLNPANGIIPSAGAVIDARGLNSSITSMTCTASPWAGITSPPPSTILLPATGTGTSATPIIISSTWILPSNTHLIGEGDDLSGTTIQTLSGTSLAPT